MTAPALPIRSIAASTARMWKPRSDSCSTPWRRSRTANRSRASPPLSTSTTGPSQNPAVFKRVMESLGVEVVPHMPAGSDGRRTTARAKGKVERPFRTVKDAHETLYHFHEPETEEEANRWLARFVATYNRADHRSEPHARASRTGSRTCPR